ncbi:hypothetical protein AB3S75_039911 [Citrus x aurantiifolia]
MQFRLWDNQLSPQDSQN